MPKIKKKSAKMQEVEIVPKGESDPLPTQRTSDEVVPKRGMWINKQRILVFSARGINHRDRHLMRDIKLLMPHHRPESKMERSKTLTILNEMCEMKQCNKAILFEGRRKRDLYMWIGNAGTGPAVKFLVENVHTMSELKMTGNCLRGSRPLLSFDLKFNEIPHLKLLKELLTQTFGVPNHHPKSKPFIDHVYTFTYLDRRIWFRNFQILAESGALAEIGPRFVLNPVKIFDGAFAGNAIWKNPNYVSPSRQRQLLKKAAKDRYLNRVEKKAVHIATLPKHAYEDIKYAEVFENNNVLDAAKRIVEKEKKKAIATKVDSLNVKPVKDKKARLAKNNEINGENIKTTNKAKVQLTNKIKQKQLKAVTDLIAKAKTKTKTKKVETIS